MPAALGDKIVTSQEMARIEREAYTRGEKAEEFMDRAGFNVAALVQRYIEHKKLSRNIFLLAGKGNNGGDGFAAAAELLRRGFSVEALEIYPFDQCGPLCKAKADSFQRLGGKIRFLQEQEPIPFPKEGILLDGLVGTGFKGKAEGVLARAIQETNQASIPIIAIDIPSGVSGDNGEVGSVAIRAALTIYLGLPKLGFFLGKGYEHIGELQKAEFGLKEFDLEHAHAEGILFDESLWPSLLPPISRTQHKYKRGYLLVWAGSPGMPGASLLSCMGALRGGAGIVRLFYEEKMVSQLASAPWEIIRQPIKHVQAIYDESERAGCLMLGPGLGRGPVLGNLFKKILKGIKCPLVIDADGLYFLAKNLKAIPSNAILTPHRGEIVWLIGHFHSEHELLHNAQAFVEKHQVVLLCKGAPTILFHPGQKPLFLPVGDPGMATAGAGDVLSGVIGALYAAGLSAFEAAIAGVCVHGKAGQIAAHEKGERSVIASDILEAIPTAYLCANPC